MSLPTLFVAAFELRLFLLVREGYGRRSTHEYRRSLVIELKLFTSFAQFSSTFGAVNTVTPLPAPVSASIHSALSEHSVSIVVMSIILFSSIVPSAGMSSDLG
ncbi:hypothetical protein BofuT4_P070670.1 [Botrytis cinerea T4]|uniref:Uncharacterized protein n=1 Tax=Botryotinia fuckeliana (strain T4) TaxID=999810 RepID=G2XQA3_BOTF4|nr:hypothetical protein BofuT4_P070670.1 [Botrytis cinerea T4]